MPETHATFAYISPSYIHIPWDLQDLLPEGVDVVATALGVSSYSDEEFNKAKEGIETAATKLTAAGAQVLVVAGNPLAVIPGREAEQAMYRDLSAKLGVPVNSSLNAMVDAFKSAGRKSCVAVNALPERINVLLRKYVEDAGLKMDIVGVPVGSPSEALNVDRDSYIRLAKDYVAKHPETDCLLFEIRGNVRQIVLQLEDELDMPVADSTRSSLRWWLKTAGLSLPVKGGGRIFDN
jgi:maleate cis-trans isomerase